MNYIKYVNSDKYENNEDEKEKEERKYMENKPKSKLKEIVFESVPEIDSKPNSTLQKLAIKSTIKRNVKEIEI